MVEASSGSTAVSQAYFAALLGLPFIAVMPAATSSAKVALIEAQCGRCHFVQNSSEVYSEAERVARETGGHYLDQFTNAEMVDEGRSGSVVTLLADNGDRYHDTYFNDEWISAQGLDPTGAAEALVEFERSCPWT